MRPTTSTRRCVDAIYEFLATKRGRSAPLRQVKEYAMGFVPPGPAWREGAAKRAADARYRGSDASEVSELENLRVIRTGQARIVLRHIYQERRAGRLARFDKGGRPWLRVVQATDDHH